AGFFSKDEILFRTYANGHLVLWTIGLLTSLLTAIYMFRLVFLTFHGPRAPEPVKAAHPEEEEPAAHHVAGDQLAAGTQMSQPSGPIHPSHPSHGAHGTGAAHLHDAPPAMAIALVVLAIGSVVAGYAGLPGVLGGGDWFARFLEPSFGVHAPEQAVVEHGLEWSLMIVSSLVAVGGIGIAAYFFLKDPAAAKRLADQFAGPRRLLERKYYVDEIYDAAIVEPIRITSENGLWKVVDVRLIDGAVNGVAETVGSASEILRR